VGRAAARRKAREPAHDEQNIAAVWRLRRLRWVEAGIFAREPSRDVSYSGDSKSDTTSLGLSFNRDGNNANAFSKHSRYETAIERSLYTALHFRSSPPGKAGDGQVEAVPEEQNGALLAIEAARELLDVLKLKNSSLACSLLPPLYTL